MTLSLNLKSERVLWMASLFLTLGVCTYNA